VTEAPAGSSAPSSPRNALEIQFFGLQRSGNHAVLSWIFQQFDEPVYFFHQVKPFTDPFLNFRFAQLPNTIPVRRGPFGNEPRHIAARERRLRRIENIRQAKKHLLAYSYENFPLTELRNREPVYQRIECIGDSEKTRRVLLLRDFYNWIASRIRLFENKSKPLPTESGVDSLISMWLTYAKEFCGKTRCMYGETVVTVSYNRWVEDEHYRTSLLQQLSAPLRDNSIAYVPEIGGGSSFDGNIAASQASEMRVTERWQYLLEDKFADIVKQIRSRADEVEAYNRERFGLSTPL
jgi:hypothetical protein